LRGRSPSVPVILYLIFYVTWKFYYLAYSILGRLISRSSDVFLVMDMILRYFTTSYTSFIVGILNIKSEVHDQMKADDN
jgi:hypothetical protein